MEDDEEEPEQGGARRASADGEEDLELEEDEELGEEEEEDDDSDAHVEDARAIKEVQDKTFDEVKLPEDIVAEVQGTWAAFLARQPSREAAAEALYSALYDAAPSLQSLFKTPRPVMSARILNGIGTIVSSMDAPGPLKITAETQGFQHLDLEVSVPRVTIFRDAIVDLLSMELETRFTSKAKIGWVSILNYVGGAYIYVKVNFSDRLKIIAASWATANNKAEGMEADGEGEGEEGAVEVEESVRKNSTHEKEGGTGEGGDEQGGENGRTMKVPKTFKDMFTFNAAVMGFGTSVWMKEVLEVFDDIVTNVSNSYRLQETCDTLALCLGGYRGSINLPEFKAVMLASLRSLVPKDWGTGHEVAWSWLWENVERMLKALLGKPKIQERALEGFILSLTEDSVNYLRRELYKRFFALAPAGQDFFKQSTTRLYWIADKVVELTIEMYREPKKMVNDLSALGLRHVGYGVLAEFFGPYVTGAVQVVKSMTDLPEAEEAFKWSLSLIGRILVRTINEGSTIVMKAVNSDSERTLRRAVSIAPRGKRALWMLNITVGTQSISPLYWAIESGSLSTANAMIKDLFVIRADRDNYYYGCDDLFERHPEIIQRLSTDAPMLLPTLMDGLIWRSHMSEGNRRRVNYYIKHLIQDKEEKFNQALEWLVQSKDPQIICHEVVTIFADLLWNRLANRLFLYSRLYFMLTLSVFIISQAILPHLGDGAADTETVRILTFVCRVFIYVGSMGQLLKNQVKQLRSDCKSRNFIRIGWLRIPGYLTSKQDAGYLVLFLLLALMCLQEPIFWCASHSTGDFPGAGMFTQDCPQAKTQKAVYANTSMFAMMLKWLLLTDLTIFSMRISAYVLVCNHVLSELCLFLLALTFLVGTFSCSIAALDTGSELFLGVPESSLSLTQIALRMFDAEQFHVMEEEETLIIAVSVFVIIVIAFLSQLLVAQISAAYRTIHENMVGYARLNRGHVIVVTMEGVSPKQWNKFLASLGFDVCLEFNEGDIGLPGGIQVLEDANAVPTTKDAIVRFGGSTHPSMPWPEDKTTIMDDGDDDKFDRLEKQLSKISKKLDELPSGGGGKKKQDGSSYGETGTGSFGASSSDSE
eukprot:TRINITY_DN6540_c0_g1_i2.p1 TRINITY_DN6540_c0_g1~~TRINITY_DN6540_c0_g1_i2.p1  ORF type:complete len:1099 (-),score=202.00 TRINITY_DN6540_c0_g1_i2:101-3397(-)